MNKIRPVKEVLHSKPTMEGAGVRLNRVFGYHEVPRLDPFLLLDHFGSDNPDDYMAGFPWHPHRGIETVTYMLSGRVEHGDSMGNSGVIGSGDVQWMTAGSGIVHQEMPKQEEGFMQGFQLWVNLPAAKKMMAPRYRDVNHDTIPEVTLDNGIQIKIVSGSIGNSNGPVKDIVVDPSFFDISIPPKALFTHHFPKEHTVIAYIYDGKGNFDFEKEALFGKGQAILFGHDDSVSIYAGAETLRFLLIAGKPINEPVAWYGPIVMNTQEELDLAFREYEDSTFLKKSA
ncbi:MAG: hypothetical protein A2487_18310 [Candidatus Raymondbacteria bacterium RifOxyC12_full_50_8]|uniref:Pirin n=1 Tax=Candidatus Raymondbacteria bacterium RIFOXYD12_FULL_49_13 TaxID=1817890 RepID=A0A1F7F5H1_UNCRA|nr:MAG: hypothetical protein A2248_03975 [Candidatus Raymondbacteria bacterium RIFOXYA2_FULL_49_16]OGJ95354.1 MAG: hypothetical protein A2487_18310 [Candidatus Raymondbacteria bacterium RifOxyC12_full_50_8]OGK01832.1 MAG: hypothetical protein A2519_03150 [Candidatus Raymondbacteria bacterium RIFOXYD12_FULL_49_13]OGP41161.1 MAG: hypothetical protein A2324_08620 [Candidatus Raymondbacteria bacterium RIFOXYB2_FULL_49_35]